MWCLSEQAWDEIPIFVLLRCPRIEVFATSASIFSEQQKGKQMSRALLVIDVQNEYFSGALPISHPDGHLQNILKAMDAATAAKVPVIVVQHTMVSTEPAIFQKYSAEWKLHADVASRPCDLLIEKNLPGSFTGTELEQWLQEHQIKVVTIAGYMSHMCCDTTARQAVHAGYTVEFLSDGTGTLPLDNSAGQVTAEELHRSILCAQQMLLSEVISTADWCARIVE